MLQVFLFIWMTGQCVAFEWSVSSIWETVQEVSSDAIDASKNLMEMTANSLQNVEYRQMYYQAVSTLENTQEKIATNLDLLKQYGSQSITQIANLTFTDNQTNLIFNLIDGVEQELNFFHVYHIYSHVAWISKQ